MQDTELDQRVVVLLSVLGDGVAGPVMEQLSPQRQAQLRSSLAQLQQSPPPEEEVERIIDDFERFFRFASESSGSMLKVFAEPQKGRAIERSAAEDRSRGGEEEEVFEMTDDPVADLNRLDSLRIAGALQQETPRTIALVLTALDNDKAAETLGQLPEQIRGAVFLQLNNRPATSKTLLAQLVRATVRKGAALDRDSLTKDDSESDRKLAELLRSMGRDDRQRMLAALEQHDAESAARINQLLYTFEDLLAIEDRSMQRLLAEVDSKTLATALKDADQRIAEKIMGNLSRRARDTLSEEIEFLGHVASEDLEAARKAVLEVVARLDQAGELIMTN